jgi:Protein of unknown function (DUF2652)
VSDPSTNLAPGGKARATLILADISGYTQFLGEVERVHALKMVDGDTPPAYPLMTTLLDSIVQSLAPPFVLAKLEGDAVFAYADDGTLDLRGAELEACLAACYRTFRGHLSRTEAALTCACNVCTSLSGLDLKFVLHHGSYVAQTIAGHTELLGPDVTFAHRMLKNGVTAATGWRAYALVSVAAADFLGLQRDSVRAMTLEYEHLAPMESLVIQLG